MEVAGEGEAVPGVVTWAASDEDGLISCSFEHVQGVFAECNGGVFHEDDRGDTELIDGALVELSAVGDAHFVDWLGWLAERGRLGRGSAS